MEANMLLRWVPEKICTLKKGPLKEDAWQFWAKNKEQPINSQVNRASATETVDLGLILGRVKPKTIKIGFCTLPA